MTSPLTRYEAHYGRMLRCFSERPSTIDGLFREAVARRPDGIAIVMGDQKFQYQVVDETVDRICANLKIHGLKKGDRIALLLGNRPEFLFMVLASARLGAIIVPMNVRQRQPEIQYMMMQSSASILIAEAALADELPEPSAVPHLHHRFFVGSIIATGKLFEDLLLDGKPSTREVVDEDDPLCILYTSGTTGRPKGAKLTHLGLIHSVLHYEYGLGLREGDIAALAVPASHVTGLVAILLATIRVAGTTVIMPGFKAQDFLELVEREKVSYTLMVPAMYNLCLLSPDLTTRNLSCWRVGGFGGAPMPRVSVENLAQAVPNLKLSNIYGATETTSPTSILPPDDIVDHGNSVGLVLPCADVLVVDPEGHEVPVGQIGELLIAGPMTIPGYWDNPKANKDSFIGGYWRSGDLGSIDVDGYLRIHDRMKDVINRGGYKIYCIEVENVILRYPGIEECAVVGYPDSVLGERVAAFVRGPAAQQIEAIHDYCAGYLTDYKVPELIMALEQPLPRNANGKIIKNELRQLAGPGR